MICLVDERLPAKAEENLLRLGFSVIKMQKSERLPEATASHPDMLCFFHEKKLISSAEYCDEAIHVFSELACSASDLNIELTADVQKNEYPYDAIFNSLVIGEHIFYKEDSVCSAIKRYASERGLSPHHVRQGYPACTVLALDERTAITADAGMGRVMRSVGIDVTEINAGNISLPPHEYGFIGGASGVYDKTVYFIGNLDTHPDSKIIKDKIDSLGYKCISLCDGPLIDLGRLIFIEDDA